MRPRGLVCYSAATCEAISFRSVMTEVFAGLNFAFGSEA